MTKELKHTDVSHAPELLRLAEEVQRTQEPRVLVRQAEKLALLMPVSPTASTRRPRKAAGRSAYPSIDELRGAAGKLDRRLPWKEMVEIAREDHLKDLLSDGK